MSVGEDLVGDETLAVAVDHGDGAASVRLVGALEGAGLTVLRQELWPLIARYDGSMVTFECAGLRRVDADGAALLGQFGRAIAPGRPVLRGLAPVVQRAMSGAGLDGWFEIDGATSG